MTKSNEAKFVNPEFIIVKINRAYEGLSYIKVSNSGKSFAYLKRKIYYYKTAKKEYKAEHTLSYCQSVFTRLIYKHKNFECEGIYYYLNTNTGEWMWMERKSKKP